MEFVEDDIVKCFFGNVAYPAKILKIDSSKKNVSYYVHYMQWKKRWDEWVPLSRLQRLSESSNATKKPSENSMAKSRTLRASAPAKKPAENKSNEKVKQNGVRLPIKKQLMGKTRQSEEVLESKKHLMKVKDKQKKPIDTRRSSPSEALKKKPVPKRILSRKTAPLQLPNLQKIVDNDIVVYKSLNGKRFLTLDDIKQYCSTRDLKFVGSDYDFAIPRPSPINRKSPLMRTRKAVLKGAKQSPKILVKTTKVVGRRRKSLKPVPLKPKRTEPAEVRKSAKIGQARKNRVTSSEHQKREEDHSAVSTADASSTVVKIAVETAPSNKIAPHTNKKPMALKRQLTALSPKKRQARVLATPASAAPSTLSVDSAAVTDQSSVLWSPLLSTDDSAVVSEGKSRALKLQPPRYTDLASESDTATAASAPSSASKRGRPRKITNLPSSSDVLKAVSEKETGLKEAKSAKQKRTRNEKEEKPEKQTKAKKTKTESEKSKRKKSDEPSNGDKKRPSVGKRGRKAKLSEPAAPECVEIQDSGLSMEPVPPGDVRLPIVKSSELSLVTSLPVQKTIMPGVQVYPSASRIKSLSESSSVDECSPPHLPLSQHKMQYESTRLFPFISKPLSPSKNKFLTETQQPFHYRPHKMDQHGFSALTDAEIDEGLAANDAMTFGGWRGVGRSRGSGLTTSHGGLKTKTSRGGARYFSAGLATDQSTYGRRRDSGGGSDSEFGASPTSQWRQFSSLNLPPPTTSPSFQYLPPQVVEDHSYGRLGGSGGPTAADFPSYGTDSSVGHGARNIVAVGLNRQQPQQRQLLVRSFSPPYRSTQQPSGSSNDPMSAAASYSPMLYTASFDASPGFDNGTGAQQINSMTSSVKPLTPILPKLTITSTATSYARPNAMTLTPPVLMPSPLLTSSASPSLLIPSATAATAPVGPMLGGVSLGHVISVTADNKMPANILEDENEGATMEEDNQPITSVVID